MLIPECDVKHLLQEHDIKVKGVLHIGAHECEELGFYRSLGLSDDLIIWLEGNEDKVNQNQSKNRNVFFALVSDQDDQIVNFNVSNNGQSSSILEFGTHSIEHPHVHFVETRKQKTITLDSFFKQNTLNPKELNFWNLDIQGVELLALKGGQEALKYVDIIYTEVNIDHLYKEGALLSELDDFLYENGFKRVRLLLTKHKWGDAIYVRS